MSLVEPRASTRWHAHLVQSRNCVKSRKQTAASAQSQWLEQSRLKQLQADLRCQSLALPWGSCARSLLRNPTLRRRKRWPRRRKSGARPRAEHRRHPRCFGQGPRMSRVCCVEGCRTAQRTQPQVLWSHSLSQYHSRILPRALHSAAKQTCMTTPCGGLLWAYRVVALQVCVETILSAVLCALSHLPHCRGDRHRGSSAPCDGEDGGGARDEGNHTVGGSAEESLGGERSHRRQNGDGGARRDGGDGGKDGEEQTQHDVQRSATKPIAEFVVVELTGTVSLANMPGAAAVDILEEGCLVFGYFNYKGQPFRQDLLIFYKPGADDDGGDSVLGSIYWGEPGAPRRESSACRLPVSDISVLYLGKHTKVLQTPFAAQARSDACFSLFCVDGTHMNFEAPTSTERQVWVAALTYICRAQGVSVVHCSAETYTPTHPAHLACLGTRLTPGSTPPEHLQTRSNHVRTSHITKRRGSKHGRRRRQSCSKSRGRSRSRSKGAENDRNRHNSQSVSRRRSRRGRPKQQPRGSGDAAGFLGEPQELFTLQKKLGQGSFGSVYRAVDNRDGTVVAVKIIKVETGAQSTGLREEVELLKQCHSPYIVAYKGTYYGTNEIWITMEFCGAGSFFDVMAICDRTLTELEIAAVVRMSLKGLEYLHGMRKIHRDVKCGNILLSEQGVCKLADFGVSVQLTNTRSRRQTVIGSPYWMAPEVLESSSSYNTKADIWSLAITAIEMALGDPPHSELDPIRALFVIPNSPAPTLPANSHWTPAFRDFLKVSLQKNPDDRPTASELLNHSFVLSGEDSSVITKLVAGCIDRVEEYWDLATRSLHDGHGTFDSDYSWSSLNEASSSPPSPHHMSPLASPRRRPRRSPGFDHLSGKQAPVSCSPASASAIDSAGIDNAQLSPPPRLAPPPSPLLSTLSPPASPEAAETSCGALPPSMLPVATSMRSDMTAVSTFSPSFNGHSSPLPPPPKHNEQYSPSKPRVSRTLPPAGGRMASLRLPASATLPITSSAPKPIASVTPENFTGGFNARDALEKVYRRRRNRVRHLLDEPASSK